MRFSERKGLTSVSNIIQKENINDSTKNLIWNALYLYIWNDRTIQMDFQPFYAHFQHHFFRQTLDNISYYRYSDFIAKIKKYFYEAEWYEIYDFLEEILNYAENKDLNVFVNNILEKELSAYRFVNGQFTDITNKQEIEMLENALTDEDFPHVKAHLQRALELLSDRKNPDYRNSIKESISAVESIAKEIAQKPKAELGAALAELEKKGKIHRAMKSAFLNLYGYTSDANGIRHALMEESNLTTDDAKFFLLSCTSFINYLKAKM